MDNANEKEDPQENFADANDEFGEKEFGLKKDTRVYRILNDVCQTFNGDLKNRSSKKSCPSLGVVRLDYDYPPALGDIACSESFTYNVYYRTVPGLTFEICKSGILTDKITENLQKSIQWLIEEKKVTAITGDCGFMMWL